MRGLIFCFFVFMLLAPTKGDDEEQPEQPEQLMEPVDFEEEETFLECFRCDLGFWDTCYTTETNCSVGERCYTGRGKAGIIHDALGECGGVCMSRNSTLSDTLDIKTLGCAKADECNVETEVQLFFNNTVFVMTKHCCDTPFCNSARKQQIGTLLHLIVVVLTAWHLTEASSGSQ